MLKAQTPIKLGAARTVGEGEAFDPAEHGLSAGDVDQLLALGAVVELPEPEPAPVPPPAKKTGKAA